MSIISEAYMMRRLNEYLKSDAGKAKVSQIRRDAFDANKPIGALTRERVERILNEVADEFVSTVITVINSFRYDGVHTIIDGMDDEACVKAKIVVDEDALQRESLHYVNERMGISHGEGVRDILALFTHGYKITSRRPYGFWVRDNVMAEIGNPLTRIGALMHRDPNPFLAEFVERMNAEYGGICNITLNDRYKGGG